MKSKEKVLIYIYRYKNKQQQVLVFDHPNVPEVNPQVPSGSIIDLEEPKVAAIRELFEESGIQAAKEDLHFLGKFQHDASYKGEIHDRYVYSLKLDNLEEQWSHTVKSHDEDNGEFFHFYWLNLEEAKKKLVVEQGKYLPGVNGHLVSSSDIESEFYNEPLKIGGINSNMSQFFGLKKIAAHYFKIPHGYRTSEPHAESLEEEFVFVISGEVDIWLNGKIKTMRKGDCYGFPAGTGVGHCFINNSGNDCELFVSGDRTKKDNQYHFHLDPSLEAECGDRWWGDMPKQVLGPHHGLPGEFSSEYMDEKISVFNSYENIPGKSFSYPNDSETFSYGVCLSRHFGMKNIAIWLEQLPPGKRSSWPHAHSEEEEFAFVLNGNPKVELDGIKYQIEKFTGVDFKAGSGVAHTIVNDSDEIVYYLCVGECDPKGDKIYYPNHPQRNQEMSEKGALWEKITQ